MWNPRSESSAANFSQRGNSAPLIRRVGLGKGMERWCARRYGSHCTGNMSCSWFISFHTALHLQRGQGECWQCSWAVRVLLSISVLCPVKGRGGEWRNTQTNKHIYIYIYIYAWCQGSSKLSIVKPTRCTISQICFILEQHYMFWSVSTSIIRSLGLYIQHQVYVIQVLWLLASGNGMEHPISA